MVRWRLSWVQLLFAAVAVATPRVGSPQEPTSLTPGAWVRIAPPKSLRFEIPGVVTVDGGVVTLLNAPTSGGDATQTSRVTEVDGLVTVTTGTSTVSFPRRRVAGTLISIDDDWITLRRKNAQQVVIPRQAVETIEIRTHKTSRGKRALIGAAIGAPALAAILAAAESSKSTPPCPYGDALSCAIFLSLSGPEPGLAAFAGVIFGAPIGAVVGAATGYEKWKPFTGEPPRVSLLVTPGRNSLSARLSVTF
jgi:hypothetical protein